LVTITTYTSIILIIILSDTFQYTNNGKENTKMSPLAINSGIHHHFWANLSLLNGEAAYECLVIFITVYIDL